MMQHIKIIALHTLAKEILFFFAWCLINLPMPVDQCTAVDSQKMLRIILSLTLNHQLDSKYGK